MALTIPAAAGKAHDLLALGALVTRLDPGIIPFAQADDYRLHVSRGEIQCLVKSFHLLQTTDSHCQRDGGLPHWPQG